MTPIEIRVAALQFLVLKLCAEIDSGRLEMISQSLEVPKGTDAESAAMHDVLVEVLSEARERVRHRPPLIANRS
jgi:hypothetical protein